jgi:predicted DNA-binding transcriptional regulator AlpA
MKGNTTMMSTLLSSPQTAKHLEITIRTLERWRKLGTGPRFILIGRNFKYAQADIDSWIESQRFGSLAELRAAKTAAVLA